MATTLAAVFDDFGRTVLIPADDVTPGMDRPYRARLSPTPDLADRFAHGTGPEPKSWELPRAARRWETPCSQCGAQSGECCASWCPNYDARRFPERAS